MKRVATVFMASILVAGFSAMVLAKVPTQKVGPNPRQISASTFSEVSAGIGLTKSSPVFLPSEKGASPLAGLIVDAISYFKDTTGDNWFVFSTYGDSTYPVTLKVGTPSHDTTFTDTFYPKGLAVRYEANFKSAFIDSVQLTFIPRNLGAKDSVIFEVRPIYDGQTTRGDVLPFVDVFSNTRTGANIGKPFARGGVGIGDLTTHDFNTITVNFKHKSLGFTTAGRHDFAIVAQADGPGIATDTLTWQLDANLSDFQSPYTVDTSTDRTYLIHMDSANQVGSQGFLTDLQEIDNTGTPTGQAYFGTPIMIAYISGTPAAVDGTSIALGRLEQNYPNPVSSTTSIGYTLAETTPVTLKVFNAVGEEVATVVNGHEAGGDHTATFDASKLPNGMYYYKIQAGAFSQTRSMVVNK